MNPKAPTGKSQAASLFFAGLLPVIAFTFIEEYYGVIPGLIAGMIFSVGEISWELYRHKKVQKITWIGSGLLIGLGAISLISTEGIWFKLQPAIMEAIFAFVLWGSVLLKKPLLVFLGEQQGHQFPPELKSRMTGFTFRLGIFFAIHAVIATWAAFDWSTTAWALLKGVGLTVSFIAYLVIEVLFLRRSIQKEHGKRIPPV